MIRKYFISRISGIRKLKPDILPVTGYQKGQISSATILKRSVSDPFHFDTDPWITDPDPTPNPN